MGMTNGQEILLAGIDFREEYPKVCYQTAQMKEPEPLPLDFSGYVGPGGCFRKILTNLKRFGKKENIRAAVVLPDMSGESIRQYMQEACTAGFLKEQLRVLSEQESVVHFVMHQTNDIWQHRVWLMEFGTDEVKASCLQVNHRTSPMLVQIEEPEYWQVGSLLEGSRDERLTECVKERFGKNAVSAVFLTGTDFNARDYKRSREEICFRRRVFLAEQIHARGACMLAAEEKSSYLFLNEQTLVYNVGIRSRKAGRESVHSLISAGRNWYEAKYSGELLLLDDNVLEFTFQSMLGGEPIQAGMSLTDLPERPGGTSRILLEIYFSAQGQCEVKALDLGFGEMYPSSELYWRETFWLGEEDEYGIRGDL